MSADTDVRQSGESETKLKRGITPMLLFFFIFGDTLGAEIYTLVGSMAKDVGGAIWLPLTACPRVKALSFSYGCSMP